MLNKCALFLFNSSMYAMEPWLEAGIPCVTVDYHDTDHSRATARASLPYHPLLTRLHIDLSTEWARADVIHQCGLAGLTPALVVSFAPCTDLAVSGARHFKRKGEADPDFQKKAAAMATLASEFDCPYAVENPISVLSTLWRKPDAIFHPSDYGGYLHPSSLHPEAPLLYPPQDAYRKKTCLWTGKGFTIPDVRPVPVAEETNPGFKALGGKSARTKHLRSLTPRGLSRAIFKANSHLFYVDKGFLTTSVSNQEMTNA